MKNLKVSIALLLTLGIIVLVALSTFTVHQTQAALVIEFGEPKRVADGPGLHLKRPWERVVFVDNRILELDTPPREIQASDQKRLVVDAFARFHITDPLQFYQRFGTVATANTRVGGMLTSALQSVVASQPRDALLSEQRVPMMQAIRDRVNEETSADGIEIVDVRFRRADLPPQNSQAIFARMNSERTREAEELRAEGREISQRIRSRADREVTVLLANAVRDSEIIRGEGDAERNRVFNEAYSQDAEFFAFYRAMQAYRNALAGDGNSFVVSPSSEFFRYFGDPMGTRH